MIVLLTTVPGLEFVVEREAAEKFGGCVQYRPLTGRVFVEVNREKLPGILSMRSIEGARLILSEASSIADAIRASLEDLRELSVGLGSFAVHAERITKDVKFTSLDVAREAGKLLADTLGLRVQLDAPDIVFYVEYDSGSYRLGVDLTPFKPLRDRPYRVWVHRSSLNPIIAYAMCVLAAPFRRLLDPFCGSGTIVLECMSVYEGVEAICADVDVWALKGASENVRAVSLDAALMVQDVVHPALREGLAVDVIITNPPFGLREKAVGGIREVYEGLFRLAERALASGGKLVVLSARRRLVEKFSSRFIEEKRIEINEGGLSSVIYVFSRA